MVTFARSHLKNIMMEQREWIAAAAGVWRARQMVKLSHIYHLYRSYTNTLWMKLDCVPMDEHAVCGGIMTMTGQTVLPVLPRAMTGGDANSSLPFITRRQ